MLTERPLHPDLRDMLISNEPFQYAHLIKFERPSRPDSNSGQVSTAKQRYTYISDASRDVRFNDGSTDNDGNANGEQIYRANKVLKVSAVSEDTEAKASSYSLTLDGNGLGAFAAGTVTTSVSGMNTYDITFSPKTDLLVAGFREGDKVTLSGSFLGSFNILNFRAPNIIRVGAIDTALSIATGAVEMELASEEIVSILLDKNAADYSSFVNREVFIYRTHFQDGGQVGSPFLLFKGIISGVSFDDGDSLTVTWNLTSHWGDFAQVRGRITSDDFHRALDQNGVPQPQSALKVAYAYDKGFSHSETSINILSQYSVQVEKQEVKVKKGFLGIGSKVKVRKYFENETRNTALDFQLAAKSIPVIYGVNITEGTPVFADTLKNDSSTVYVAEVLSEGEIGGIYDVYVEGNSLICNDKADFDARSTQTADETVKLICRGRSDRGDVLGGTVSTVPTYKDYYDYYSFSPQTSYKFSLDYDLPYLNNYPKYVEPVTTVVDSFGAGIIDGQSITLTSPQKITLDVFSGKPGQRAAASLVTIAKANNFKIQNDYWSGTDTADYWSPNHRLLDTAYVVGKYKIEEGETTIPSTEYIVRGKVVNCYNYDKSYSHDAKMTGESADNFNLGDYVSLQRPDGSILNANVQIIDKWTFANPDGTRNTRFRYSQDPALGYVNGVPSITRFRMIKGSATWHMITYNYRILEGVVPTEWKTTVISASNSNGYVQFGFPNNAAYTVGGDPAEASSAFGITDVNGYPVDNPYFGYSVLIGTVSAAALTTKYSWSATGPAATAVVGRSLVRRNVISLPLGSSTVDGYYNGYIVTLSRQDSFGKVTTQQRTIIDYVGSSRLATIDGLWDYGYHPKVDDKLYLTPAYADSRVTINTAMQLMDYVTSPTYGRGLHPTRDLNFPSWLESGRLCDAQSDVTVLTTSGSALAGSIYRYPASGNIVWQGKVVGSEGQYVQFTENIGKLTNAWNNWKSYNVNELVYADGMLYQVTSPGVKTTKPNHSSGTVSGLTALSSLTLTRVNGGGSDLSTVVNGNPIRASRNGVTVPGYTLYDSDGVDYWRLLGWDEHQQRYVTKHQTNIIVDTAIPLLDNVNSFLEHFGGILRYSSGQYFLEVEDSEGPISSEATEPRNITADEIIGKIRVVDEGIRGSFNSLTASYTDPANKFDSRNVSFFNSDYLRADKNVPKKGSVTIPGITNYYNTRMLADKFLNKSRFGLTVSFNMRPSGVILLAGTVIQVQYPKYGWVDKKLRIKNLTHQDDASVDIVAEEYDDSFYGLTKISKQAASGLAGNTATIASIAPPTDLRASSLDSGDETVSGVEITWTNNPVATPKNTFTELYSSFSPELYVQIGYISDNVLTTIESAHGLVKGELITSSSSIAGLEARKSYFVKDIITPNSFTISETKNGPVVGLNNITGISANMLTANLIATVAVPANSYVDVFGGINGRVTKYYWVRHKVVQA